MGIAPVILLSSPDSITKLRKDVRMSVFCNIRSQAKGGASSDGLRRFLSAAKASLETLSKPELVLLFSHEIGKKLLGLMMRPANDEVDESVGCNAGARLESQVDIPTLGLGKNGLCIWY